MLRLVLSVLYFIVSPFTFPQTEQGGGTSPATDYGAGYDPNG